MKHNYLTAVIFLISMVLVSPANALETRPYLSLKIAKVAAQACEAMAMERGWKMAIVIKDNGGNLVYFSRMDDAFSKATDIALLKAEASSKTSRSTLELRKIALEDNVPPLGIERIPGIVVFDGGVPIKTNNGYHLGGIGVSGSSANNDGICARHGVDTIMPLLK